MKQTQRRRAEGILYTDQYQLTMAHLYYRMGLHERPAQFDHFFRRYPVYNGHQSGYAIAAGLAWLLDWMEEAHFTEEATEYLGTLTGSTGRRLFDDDFLQWLRRHGNFSGITLRAIPEGRVVHPSAPMTTVQGPLAMAQILETSLLNHINYQTLIATKAARISAAGRGQLLLEFGLRRAQDRAASAGARAALIGGADFTSNTGMSWIMGLDPKGTHAHSMVQAFMALGQSERDAFQAYADIYPDDTLLLVDTIDTLRSGIPNAIRVFEKLRARGHEPIGIRLDSGDLAYLTVRAAKMLDEAGFEETSIVLSNSLDELTIWQILTQISEDAPRYGLDADHVIGRLVYGVGTRLITSRGAAALDGVYKLVAVEDEGEWQPAIKISETPEKIPNPGDKRVWRIYDRRGSATADLLTLDEEDPREMEEIRLRHPIDHTKMRTLTPDDCTEIELLHVDVLREGALVYETPELDAIRQQRRRDLERLDPGVRRLMNPHIYHVSVTQRLWELKQSLIAEARGHEHTE